MSKSYRKPWGTFSSVKSSAHDDKKVAARAVRRAQNQALQDAVIHDADWDEFVIPIREECSYNDPWSWHRDGRQHPFERSKQYNNPFAYVTSPTWFTLEEIFKYWEECKKFDDDFLEEASRK